MGLGRDRAVTHGAGCEPLYDLRDPFNLVDWDRLAVGAELEQSPQRGQPFSLGVHHGGVLLKDVVPL